MLDFFYTHHNLFLEVKHFSPEKGKEPVVMAQIFSSALRNKTQVFTDKNYCFFLAVIDRYPPHFHELTH